MNHEEIARWTQTTANNITITIDRLERDGFVNREQDNKNRRVWWVKMTDKRFKALNRTLPVAEQYVRKIIASVTNTEALENALKTMRENTR
jgi:DNA-binding MarR family transcriptional regulator